MLIPRIARNTAGVGLWCTSLRQELIPLQALGLGPSACSLHTFPRVSADAGRLEILAYMGSCPQDNLKVRQPSSLVYRPRHGVLPNFSSALLFIWKRVSAFMHQRLSSSVASYPSTARPTQQAGKQWTKSRVAAIGFIRIIRMDSPLPESKIKPRGRKSII